MQLTDTEREWLEYAIAHMLDDDEPEDQTCAAALRRLIERIDESAQEPTEGHSVQILSHDGEWKGEARWEYQERAYVTQQAVRPAQEKAEPVGHARTDGCMHFAYLPWSVKDGDPVYAAPPEADHD